MVTQRKQKHLQYGNNVCLGSVWRGNYFESFVAVKVVGIKSETKQVSTLEDLVQEAEVFEELNGMYYNMTKVRPMVKTRILFQIPRFYTEMSQASFETFEFSYFSC